MREKKSDNKSYLTIKQIKEKSVKTILFLTSISAIFIVFAIIIFLLRDAIPFFNKINIIEFLTGTKWAPAGTRIPSYGALPLIVGSLLITLGAMVIAIPLSIGSAIFISELAPPWLKNILKPAVELLAGVPSVIFGYFGILVLVPWIMVTFNEPTGLSWLAASILLGIMAIPTITSVAEDAISSVPREYKEGSLAVGATKWQTISKVIIPSSISGITAAIILGFGRAIGETIAVSMVAGSPPYGTIPDPLFNVFARLKTLTAAIVGEAPEAARDSLHMHALFALAIILLIIALVVNLIATYILGRIKEKHTGCSKRKNKIATYILKSITFNRLVKYKKYFTWIFYLFLIYLAISIFGIFSGTAILVIIGVFYLVNKILSRKNVQRVWFAIIIGCMITVVLFLGMIIYYIVSNGIGVVNWQFISSMPSADGKTGGILPAIIGTLLLVAGAIAIAVPLGIGTAIYLNEYTKEGKITKIIRTAVDLLNGTPSIVFGLFGIAFLVYYIGWGVSILAGWVTLAFMILPTIIRTSEEALKNIPQSLREGSYAVGATKWQTIRKVVLPPAAPGIITGTILGIGRAAGETAPVILVCGTLTQKGVLPDSIFSPVNSLTFYLYNLKRYLPGTDNTTNGIALVLLLLIIGVYLIAIIIRNYYHKKMKW